MNNDAKKQANAILNYITNEDLEQTMVNPETPTSPVIVSSSNEFNGKAVGLQVNVPSDLRDSLRLLSCKTGKSMAQIVFSCLTTQEIIHKSWVSTKNSNLKEDAS